MYSCTRTHVYICQGYAWRTFAIDHTAPLRRTCERDGSLNRSPWCALSRGGMLSRKEREPEYYSLVVLAVGGVKCVKLNLTAPFCGSLMNEINRRAEIHPLFGPRDKWVQMTSTQDREYGSSNPRSCSLSYFYSLYRCRYRSRFSGPLKAVPIRNTRSSWLFYDTVTEFIMHLAYVVYG